MTFVIAMPITEYVSMGLIVLVTMTLASLSKVVKMLDVRMLHAIQMELQLALLPHLLQLEQLVQLVQLEQPAAQLVQLEENAQIPKSRIVLINTPLVSAEPPILQSFVTVMESMASVSMKQVIDILLLNQCR